MEKRVATFYFLICLVTITRLSLFCDSALSSLIKSGKDPIIVIDPGHGGKDRGAVGPTGLEEKVLSLNVAKKLQRLIQKNLGMRVLLTRGNDHSVSLKKRALQANGAKAILFISLHMNASFDSKVSGVRCYFVRFDAASPQRYIVKQKKIIRSENGSGKEAEDVKAILSDMVMTSVRNESGKLAQAIQNELSKVVSSPSGTARQAFFSVLMQTMMPSVLVEMGYITNPKEENKFRQEKFQTHVAYGIYRGIKRYLEVSGEGSWKKR